jgi:heme/copper-type cytochrome/quinol oxidase subunit 2
VKTYSELKSESVMVSGLSISWTMIGCLSVIVYLSIMETNLFNVYAQEAEELIVRRVAIWDLFYQGMVAAFTVGALVQGTLIYIYWRFRESNPKHKVRTQNQGV